MATIKQTITIDGTFADWDSSELITTPATVVPGYSLYGTVQGDTYFVGIQATGTTDPVIGAGTTIWLNTDQNTATGYSPFGNIGAEYNITYVNGAFYLYTGSAAQNLVSPTPLTAALSADGTSLEIAIPRSLITPAGGTAPTNINIADWINNGAVYMPTFYTLPEYTIVDPATAVPPTTIGNLITLDGEFTDWPATDIVTNPGNVAAGYQIYGAFLNDATFGNTYVIGIDATVATDPVIGMGATLYLNTDQNNTTGYELSFANVGAEYEIKFAYDTNAQLQPFLYSVTSAGVTTLLNGGAPLHGAFSSNGESVELAIPQALLAPAGSAAPTSINFVSLNGAQGLPTDLANDPQFTITDTAALLPKTATHKVAIVYSDTTAKNYFRGLGDAAGAPSTTYDDLFMAVQNQVRMAGVSYDVIDESQLTDVKNLVGYDALIFPDMANVDPAQLPVIMKALTSAVYDYHIGIITSGNFLTNDQNGAALPGNSYANMETLLGLQHVSGAANTGDVTVTAADVSNPIMKSYAAGQVIQTYTSVGYDAFTGAGGVTPDVLVNENIAGGSTLPGVVETTTGGTNVHFATQALMGDSNLLSNAIQSVVLGTTPSVTLHTSRDAGIVAVRMDMDQAQVPADVSPAAGGPGIYDKLLPILTQWKAQYDFVGSYYVDIGDNPNPPAGSNVDPTTTNWAKSLPYYEQILALGGEIGTHSYTHLINPPTTTFTAHTVGATAAGATTITLDQVPSFYGITVGLWLTGTGIGANTALPGAAGEGGAVANTQVIAVNGNTITISYVPAGFGGTNQGTIGTIPDGATLTFSVPPENTNFLEPTTGTNLSSDGSPFTYAYEFGTSKTTLEQQLSLALGQPFTIYGAAVPGAAETAATSQNIMAYFPSGTGYTGYISGGWTGIDSGYPSAFGYINPTQQGAVYIAPNMTFDFTEIQYEGKSVAQAEADWAAQFNALTANAAGTPVVVLPVHDYGVAAWNTTTDSPTGSPYTTQMYADFIANAYAKNYEFVTLEDLASRVAASEKAQINYTTSGNTITATVTPDPTAPDLGAMALDVVNGGTQVIQNVTGWYAYSAQELFLPYGANPQTYTITLGTTQDAVTHIFELPMRADLRSVTGNGQNLSFSVVGDGVVKVALPQAGDAVVVTGTGVASYGVSQTDPKELDITLTGLGQHDVSIVVGPAGPTEFVTSVAFSPDSGASTTDFITNVAAQTISGKLSGALAAGDFVQVSLDGGITWLTATAATGSDSFSLSAMLTGSNTLIAKATNAAGLSSAALTQAYVLDLVPPTETATIAAMTDDSAAADFITNNGDAGRTVTGKLSAALASDESLRVSMDGGASWIVPTVTGTDWTAIDATSHAATWTIEAQVVDLAGNLGPLATRVVTFDNTPPAAPSAPDLIATSDNGTSSTDNITSITVPTFIGTAEANSLVTLLDGTTSVGTGEADENGNWSVTATALSVGVHTISATATDVAGNVSTASSVLSVSIVAPPLAPSVPDLIATSDSGRSTADNITNVVAPTFKGTATAGVAVTLFDGTTQIGSGVATATGTWQITASSALLDGPHSINAVATNAAGIASAPSAALSVTIDTIALAPSTPDMTAATDRGVSNTDNNTNDNTPTFTGTAEAAAQVTLYEGSTILGTARASATGVYTITSTVLTDGTHNISASQVDVAGNSSVLSAALSVMIDTIVPPAPSPPVLSPTSDSGALGDNITNDTTPTFTGTAEAGTTVSIYNGTNKVGTGIADANGNWTVTTSSMGNGVHVITTKATDVAGNVSAASAALSITIDATAPARPALPDLLATSDTGVSSTDNITKITTPSLAGTAEALSTVTVYDGTTVLGTTAATALGTWTLTPTLGNGTHSITVKATDAAGNVSAASSALALTIDTTAPGVPAFSGGNATTLRGTGEAGDTVTILNGGAAVGTATVGSAGNWSWSFIAGSSPLAFTALQTDKAGNVGSATAGSALVGTSSNNTLTSTGGNDLLVGAGGTDTFSFSGAFGHDIITDFAATGAAHDFINLLGNGVLNSFANVLAHTTQTTTGVVIGDGTNTLTLNNVTKTSLTSADFRFA